MSCSPTSRGPGQRRFAVAETLSHLERLVSRGGLRDGVTTDT